MSNSRVIEVAGEQVGLVVRCTRGVRFFAADRSTGQHRSIGRLEGRVFANPAAATRAAAALLAGRSAPGRDGAGHVF